VRERVLGTEHPDTLTTLAYWTKEAEQVGEPGSGVK